ncbi:MAG: hypothetical protein J3K34DRAFT_107132 [Monoraphidium minutum]|nr:MAG: hypothetical protein J3K34DRAFT_107132 [Monoraphidium minutum]
MPRLGRALPARRKLAHVRAAAPRVTHPLTRVRTGAPRNHPSVEARGSRQAGRETTCRAAQPNPQPFGAARRRRAARSAKALLPAKVGGARGWGPARAGSSCVARGDARRGEAPGTGRRYARSRPDGAPRRRSTRAGRPANPCTTCATTLPGHHRRSKSATVNGCRRSSARASAPYFFFGTVGYTGVARCLAPTCNLDG